MAVSRSASTDIRRDIIFLLLLLLLVGIFVSSTVVPDIRHQSLRLLLVAGLTVGLTNHAAGTIRTRIAADYFRRYIIRLVIRIQTREEIEYRIIAELTLMVGVAARGVRIAVFAVMIAVSG